MGSTAPAILIYENYAGAIKAFKALVAALAAAGHDCEAVAVPSVPHAKAPSGRAARRLPVQPGELRGGGCNVGKAVLGPTESRRGEPDSVGQRLVYRELGALVRRTIEAWNPDRVIVGHSAFHLRSALALARKSWP